MIDERFVLITLCANLKKNQFVGKLIRMTFEEAKKKNSNVREFSPFFSFFLLKNLQCSSNINLQHPTLKIYLLQKDSMKIFIISHFMCIFPNF